MIRGAGIHLRLAREDDLRELAELLNDVEASGEFWPNILVPEPTLRKRYEEDGFWGKDFGQLLICGPDDRILGEIMFFKTAGYMSELEIAYRLFRPEDRGKGFTTEALALMTRFLFESKEFNRLRLMIDPANIGSRRVAEKCGYRHEGTARGSVFHHGQIHDMDTFAILRDEALSATG
jgi:ribosomal-protein-alanine N-acetyltransferase